MWQKLSMEVTNPQKRREGLRVGTSLASASQLQLYYRHSRTTINSYHPHQGATKMASKPIPRQPPVTGHSQHHA